jgi:cytochrome c oxidase subunit 2
MTRARPRIRCDSVVRHSVIALAIALSGCSGIQSALDPKGPKAAEVLHLTWFLAGTAVVVYVVVVAMLVYVLRRGSGSPVELDQDLDTEAIEHDSGMKTWVVAATVLTTIILIGFVFVDLSTARSLSTVGGTAPLRIDVVGHQWWWEVKYPDPNDPQNDIETANEIHVPVGRAVLIKMKSADVIHSFWAPNLDGKKDLIPGHETVTWFRADTVGVYRGQCAEFCGYEHAKMAFYVVAEPRIEFERWLAQQRREASTPSDSLAREGERVFLSGSCAMCHSIAGTGAGSNNGPDLTHLASRRTIAAGTLPNTAPNLESWILAPQMIKPGTKMPANQIDPRSLRALVAYLQQLK